MFIHNLKGILMYTNYQILTVNNLEYKKIRQKFDKQSFQIKKNNVHDLKTVSFVRKLGVFEAIAVFFELIMASLRSCVYGKAPYLTDAWKELKSFRWVRIVNVNKSEADIRHFYSRPENIKIIQKHQFFDSRIRKNFEDKLNKIVGKEGIDTKTADTSNLKFRQKFVERSLSIPDDEHLYELVDDMVSNPKEMTAFAEGLFKDNSLLLNRYLLRECKVVFGDSEMKRRQKRLSALISVLTPLQIELLIESSHFLKLCVLKESSKAIAISFDSEAFGKLASSLKSKKKGANSFEMIQEALPDIIGNLPKDRLVLGKLIALLPAVGEPCRIPFIEQIKSYAAFYRSFLIRESKIENSRAKKEPPLELGTLIQKFEALLLYYIEENTRAYRESKQPNLGGKVLSTPKPPVHYHVNLGHLNTVYKNEEIKKLTFNQTDLTNLIKSLENTDVHSSEIAETLASMDQTASENFIKLIPAESKALENFWKMESKPQTARSLLNDRVRRLEWIFPVLSEKQLKASSKFPSFVALLSDDHNDITETAANFFSIDQLVWIASDWLTHIPLKKIILKLEKKKFKELIDHKDFIPHCTPFLSTVLIAKLESNLFIKDKSKTIKEIKEYSLKSLYDKKGLASAWDEFSKQNPNW